MFAVIGLGNPGKQYAGTRHNVGFDTVDYLAFKNDISLSKVKHQAVIGEGVIQGKKVLLVKPQTFMNLSGRSVLEICSFYKLGPQQLVVIYDDIDIEVGKLRIRPNGSGGTHNGMKSIIYEIQSDSFPRIRIGIGRPAYGDLADFVTSRFSKEDRDFVNNVIVRAAEAVEVLIKEGIDTAMNKYNG